MYIFYVLFAQLILPIGVCARLLSHSRCTVPNRLSHHFAVHADTFSILSTLRHHDTGIRLGHVW